MAASSYAGSIVSTRSDSDRGDPRFSGGGNGGGGGHEEPALEAAFGAVDAAVFAAVLGVTVSKI